MRAFIVRPFNEQSGVDFEAVERLLIGPALGALGIDGRTTQEIVAQGNIRSDMFRLLVTADIVVADLSIHNANVFYELGIRHGLRANATFLLRANIDKYPFDLATDRYFVYDAANPAASLEGLTTALRTTLAGKNVDSPVYEMLPSLKPYDPTLLRVVPRDFREDVERALKAGYRGDLRLFAHESRGFEWESEGLRTVGHAQIKLKAFSGARETFEGLLKDGRGDVDADQRLATIYQRLAIDDPRCTPEQRRELFALSNQSIHRILESPVPSPRERAEAFALQARNVKSEWREALPGKAETGAAALRSPQLKEAADLYARGFEQDLNHYYSGLNALSLYRLLIDLAKAQPAVWAEAFDSEEEDRQQLKTCEAVVDQLTGAVRLSLRARRNFLDRQNAPDEEDYVWMRMSEADFSFLTSAKAAAVGRAYRQALADVPEFDASSAREQLELFRMLGVRNEFVAAALAVFDELAPRPSAGAVAAGAPTRVLLFTGHMIDEPGRSSPRFPRTSAAEAEARRLITEAVTAELRLASGATLGLAGGACGGDLLFHEACAGLGIETQLFLALPPDAFAARSVQRGGPEWVERFNRLCEKIPARVLSQTAALPNWLLGKDNYTIWQRNNYWILFNALALDARSLTLIALWDGESGDGPGGTSDLVAKVIARGYKVVILDVKRLKDLVA